jgi:toxin CptA
VSAAAVPVIQQPPPPRARTLAESLARGWEMRDIRLLLVGRAWRLGFTELLLALLPAGLLLLWQQPRRHAMQRLFLAGLVAICLVFFGVYMSLGFLTRYIYFAAPIICLACGAALSALWRRPGGRWLVLAVVALVIATGLLLWFGAAIVRDEPSLVPLTH